MHLIVTLTHRGLLDFWLFLDFSIGHGVFKSQEDLATVLQMGFWLPRVIIRAVVLPPHPVEHLTLKKKMECLNIKNSIQTNQVDG